MGLESESESEWVQIHSSISQIAPRQGGIPPLRLLDPRDKSIIRVWCGSTKAKSTWRFGGTLYQFVSDGIRVPDVDANSWAIGLNRLTIVEVPKITTVYRLRFEFAYWHTEIQLKIEEFTGTL